MVLVEVFFFVFVSIKKWRQKSREILCFKIYWLKFFQNHFDCEMFRFFLVLLCNRFINFIEQILAEKANLQMIFDVANQSCGWDFLFTKETRDSSNLTFQINFPSNNFNFKVNFKIKLNNWLVLDSRTIRRFNWKGEKKRNQKASASSTPMIEI